MLWGGRWEGGSCLGTHVRIKDFKIKKKEKKNVCMCVGGGVCVYMVCMCVCACWEKDEGKLRKED